MQGHPTIQGRNLKINVRGLVSVPNLRNPGVKFTFDAATGPSARQAVWPNLASPGVGFAKSYMAYNIETRPQHFVDARLGLEDEGTLNMSLTGISRDSAGVALGGCTVLLFRTQDRTLVAETVSDGAGNYSFSVMKGGPFFLVEYKAGSPDVSGTSLNTLVPVQVP